MIIFNDAIIIGVGAGLFIFYSLLLFILYYYDIIIMFIRYIIQSKSLCRTDNSKI
jgi:hypothetical protein